MIHIIKPDTCRTCEHSRPLDNTRPGEPDAECRGGPPQIVAFMVGTPHGPQLQVQTLMPRIKLSDEKCGAYKSRIHKTTQ